MDNYLINLYNERKLDYKNISFKKTNEVSGSHVTFSIIIPVMNRVTFHKPLVHHLKAAAMYLRNHSTGLYKDVTFSITFVEHSHEDKHSHLARTSGVNHIWIPKERDEPFNKCMAMNMGALYSNSADYYLFHDIDLLMHWGFFLKILQNFKKYSNVGALQTFGGRRVVYMDEVLSHNVITEQFSLDEAIRDFQKSMTYSKPGAPGGSICVKSKNFFNVGGYDAEFFHSYSPEDRFFWRKLEYTCGIQGCDDPLLESYHMWHPSMVGTNPDGPAMEEIMNKLENELEIHHKMNYIYHVAKNFKRFTQ